MSTSSILTKPDDALNSDKRTPTQHGSRDPLPNTASTVVTISSQASAQQCETDSCHVETYPAHLLKFYSSTSAKPADNSQPSNSSTTTPDNRGFEREIISKALSLNKEKLLGKAILEYGEAKNFDGLRYDSIDKKIIFDPQKTRTFYHEAAHAVFDVYYENDSDPYFAADQSKKDEFNIAAKAVIKNIYDFLARKNLVSTELDHELPFEETLSSLKHEPIIAAFWMHSLSQVAHHFDDFWEKTLSPKDDTYLPKNNDDICNDYFCRKPIDNDGEEDGLPFHNPCEIYMKMLDYIAVCHNPDIPLQQPSDMLFPVAKKIVEESIRRTLLNDSQREFIESIAHLVYYYRSEYSLELIARVVEFSGLDNDISNLILPLQNYLNSEFTPTVEKLYRECSGCDYQQFTPQTVLQHVP